MDFFNVEKDLKLEAVKCIQCGKLMDAKSDDFVAIYGNLCIGLHGGLIGNNFDEEGKLKNISIFCKDCFSEVTEPIKI